MSEDFGVNQGLVEELFLRWAANPASVEDAWRNYFEAMAPEQYPTFTTPGTIAAPDVSAPGAANGSNGAAPFFPSVLDHVPREDHRGLGSRSFTASSETLEATELQGRLSAMINGYRVRGHLFADLDPLGLHPRPPENVFLKHYGLERVDPSTVFSTGDMAGPARLPLGEIVRRLEETYCRTIGVEYTFLEDPEELEWLQQRMEERCNRLDLSQQEQLRILTKLTDAEIFEQFLHTNYLGAKRFSLEGAESVIPMLDLLVEHSGDAGVEEIVIGMAHRGRLNVLANIMEMNVRQIFSIFEDDQPEAHIGRGDVKYHLGYSTDRKTQGGHRVHLTLSFNPSHLEFVGPVVEGRVRAKMDRRGDLRGERTLPLLIHGDGAFMGQGVVAETLNLGQLQGYATGGTLHVVINNQIGFTTSPRDGRSSRYCTDIVRMLRCPVFHVNGEDPEAVAQVVQLATEYRQRYHRDVVIDLYCYRKYGHNEGDEPRFTQPLMYRAVDAKQTVRQVYVRRLVEMGKLTEERAEEIKRLRREQLDAALEETRSNGSYYEQPQSLQGVWSGYQGGPLTNWDPIHTALPREVIEGLISKLTRAPGDFQLNKKVRKNLLEQRYNLVMQGQPFDWGTAEWLALGSLLIEGTRVRLTGQDSRRGTFSHRHAVLFDKITGAEYSALSHLSEEQARFEIYDSPLSEAGTVGFEYGYSLDSPDALVLWEAQFGDFVNGAQVIIDQFISSSEDKWYRLSGLVLLLPHGFEGQGPEHSSARLERFLALCAEDNLRVCNLTTPAQYFHCLRRQVRDPARKPLVVMTPKSLLRLKLSTIEDLTSDHFHRILPEVGEIDEPERVRRVIFCSGKVYYDLVTAREHRQIKDIAILRLEQLYPLRLEAVREAIAPYANAEVVWVQEEPANMGAWAYLHSRLCYPPSSRIDLRCVARPESASPATGSHEAHKLEQKRLIDEAFQAEPIA